MNSSIAALSQLAVILSVIVVVGPGQLIANPPRMFQGPHFTLLLVLTGYAGAFLTLSGLESISQLSPVMGRAAQADHQAGDAPGGALRWW